MSDTIQVDIVTPEKKIFSENNILSVTVPGIEGDMGILNNHIPIITFLRPGSIQIQAQNKDSSFFISFFLSSEISFAIIKSATISPLLIERIEKKSLIKRIFN